MINKIKAKLKEDLEIALKALEYCAVPRELLHSANNRQENVALSALANIAKELGVE